MDALGDNIKTDIDPDLVKLLMSDNIGKEGYCCIHILFCDRYEVGPGQIKFDVRGSFSGRTRLLAIDIDMSGIIEPLVEESYFDMGPLDLKNEILSKDTQINGDARSINFYYLCDRNPEIREPIKRALEEIRPKLSRTLIIHEEGDDVVAWVQINDLGIDLVYGAGVYPQPAPPKALEA